MQNVLLALCLLLFIFVMIPLSILGHELGHALAMMKFHCHGKPIIICLGCEMTLNPQTGKCHWPASSWIIRRPRLLLAVAPSIKVIFLGRTYGYEKLSPRQRFRMILAGPLTSLGLALVWSAGAWVILHAASQSRTHLDALWLQIALGIYLLCGASAIYNGLFFLLSILPIPNRKRMSFSQKTALTVTGSDGYQLLCLWREHFVSRAKQKTRG
jgi:hypothetical protein